MGDNSTQGCEAKNSLSRENSMPKAATTFSAQREETNVIMVPKDLDSDRGRDLKEFPLIGVKLEWFTQFIAECGGRDALAAMTTSDMCEKFVKPRTEAAQVSLCEMLAADPKTTSFVSSRATHFISHAWASPFLETVAAIENFFSEKVPNEVAESAVLWFDLVSNCQHGVSSHDFDWWTGVFMNAIKNIGNVVMVMHPWKNPTPLQRAWCVYELLSCIQTDSKFHVALSESEHEKCLNELCENSGQFLTFLGTIKSEASQAGKIEDKEAIHSVIHSTVTFTVMDSHIFRVFENWMVFAMKRRIDGLSPTSDSDAMIRLQIARLQQGLGRLYKNLSKFTEAHLQLTISLSVYTDLLGREHPTTISALQTLAELYSLQGRYTEAENVYVNALEDYRRVLGNTHRETLVCMENLAAVYRLQGNTTDAEVLSEEAFRHQSATQGEADNIVTMNSLAVTYFSQRQHQKAEALYVKALEAGRRVLGSSHHDTITIMNNLAMFYESQGKYEEAEALNIEALEQYRRTLGNSHMGTLQSIDTLASLYVSQEKYDKAEALYIEALEGRRREIGNSHPDTLESVNNLALLYKYQQKYRDAESLYIEAVDGTRQTMGSSHHNTVTFLCNLALLYQAEGKTKEAEERFLEAISGRDPVPGKNKPALLHAMKCLGVFYGEQGRLMDAYELLRDGTEGALKVLGTDDPDTVALRNNFLLSLWSLGMFYKEEGMLVEAAKFLRESADEAAKFLGTSHPDTLEMEREAAIARNLLVEADK
ncbi:hypothetical protein BJ742DRAFT_826267 [Cladochytrium replicatum]|nr:hypothetical protein BJ742DRAFT_826267 [Cladochytrium replicatum]